MSQMKDDLSNLSDDAKEKLSSDFTDLKANFSKLRNDVMSLLQDTLGVGKAGGSAVGEQARHAMDNLKSRAQDLQGNLSSRAHDLQDRSGEAVDAIGEKISENPVAAALIAVGVGFVVAKLLTHRR